MQEKPCIYIYTQTYIYIYLSQMHFDIHDAVPVVLRLRAIGFQQDCCPWNLSVLVTRCLLLFCFHSRKSMKDQITFPFFPPSFLCCCFYRLECQLRCAQISPVPIFSGSGANLCQVERERTRSDYLHLNQRALGFVNNKEKRHPVPLTHLSGAPAVAAQIMFVKRHLCAVFGRN